jgi:hypothetical protein
VKEKTKLLFELTASDGKSASTDSVTMTIDPSASPPC